MNNQVIINKIKELCKTNGITISQLEKNLFLSPGLISRWNKSTPTLDRLIDIANYFNVTLDTIVPTKDSTAEECSNLELLVTTLYEKSIDAVIEWSVLDFQKIPADFSSLSNEDLEILHIADCYYLNIGDGYFFLQTLYSINDELNISLYALADKHSHLKLLSNNTHLLENLYKYLNKRLSRQLTDVKTNAFINTVLEDLKRSENDNSFLDNITSIAANS